MNEEKSSDELTQIVMLQRQVANLRAIANELFYFNRATLGVGNTKTMSRLFLERENRSHHGVEILVKSLRTAPSGY